MGNRFIDLFAGIGGFHEAAKNNGLNFVFASEIDENAKEIYELNHNVKVNGDITKIDEKVIPDFDWLFAGFPCQAFSVGGKRKGFEDTRGTLFFDVARIAKYKQPKMLLLENVKGLLSHDNGNTWSTILMTLDQIGYYTTELPIIASPHHFGIPQRRERVFIPCIRKDLVKSREDFKINLEKSEKEINLNKLWMKNKGNQSSLKLSKYHISILDAWREFKDVLVKGEVINFSIWMEYWGKEEKDIIGEPKWKLNTITKNLELYNRMSVELDKWISKYNVWDWFPTHRKFEWSVGENIKFNDSLIQFRPSGIRAVKPTMHPTITTIINQTAIIPSLNRKASIDELKWLQSFPSDFKLPENYGKSVKVLGNSVNVKVVDMIIKEMMKYG